MNYNYFSVTFWFNIFDNHNEFLSILQENLGDEFSTFNVSTITNNLAIPIIRAENLQEHTNLLFSQINLQYNMEKIDITDFAKFKEKTINIFNLLTQNGIDICHTAVFINGEKSSDNSLKEIGKNSISSKLFSKDLVDINLKLGKKHEDLFYKIVTLFNKKEFNVPKIFDKVGRLVPFSLIPLKKSVAEKELIDISYEINDKYLFDTTENYHTTEFYLNKMLYLISNDFDDDVNNIMQKGKF